MILKNLKIENFRSYKEAFIEFSPTQNYFFGKNWQGKSSVMDAIGFALFGKGVFPSRIAGSSVKVSNLLREGATKGLVHLSFEHNELEYNLVRECPGSSVELSCNGKILGKNITTVKEALYENFGLDNKLFANVFYSEQDDLRKILESTPEDRKIFIEMLLGFEYLKSIKMSAKHTFDGLTDFIDEISSGNIKTIIDLIDGIKEQVTGKEKNVEYLEKQIKEESKPPEYFSIVSKRMSESQEKSENLLEIKSKVQNESDNNKNISQSITTGKCPTCKQVIPKDIQLKVIHELKDKINELENRIKTLDEDYSKANSEWSKASREYEKGLTLDEKISGFKNLKKQNEIDLKELKSSLNKYETQYKAFSNKTKVIDIINNEKNFLSDLQSAIESFRDKLRNNMTQDLESGVNHFMSQFSDNDFDANLKINDEFGFEVILHNKSSPIFNMSGAAKDILALAVRYGLYRIAASDVNFILFDEPTRHMDSVNTLKLKQAFNEMTNQQIIVITVHDEFYDAQGTKFMIEKDANLLSTLKQMN